MNAGQRGEWHLPQTDATVVLKEDAAVKNLLFYIV